MVCERLLCKFIKLPRKNIRFNLFVSLSSIILLEPLTKRPKLTGSQLLDFLF